MRLHRGRLSHSNNNIRVCQAVKVKCVSNTHRWSEQDILSRVTNTVLHKCVISTVHRSHVINMVHISRVIRTGHHHEILRHKRKLLVVL